jgi:hypothetical protein
VGGGRKKRCGGANLPGRAVCCTGDVCGAHTSLVVARAMARAGQLNSRQQDSAAGPMHRRHLEAGAHCSFNLMFMVVGPGGPSFNSHLVFTHLLGYSLQSIADQPTNSRSPRRSPAATTMLSSLGQHPTLLAHTPARVGRRSPTRVACEAARGGDAPKAGFNQGGKKADASSRWQGVPSAQAARQRPQVGFGCLGLRGACPCALDSKPSLAALTD